MKYVRILADAWALTTSTKKLTWFVFGPSVAFIIMFIAEVAWQYSMAGEEFGWIEEGRTYQLIGDSVSAVSHSGAGWLVLLVIGIGALFLFVLEPWIHATLILSIHQKFEQPERRLSLRKQLFDGHAHFVKLLEYHALLAPFSMVSLILYTASFFRYTHGGDTFYSVFLPFLIIMGVLAIFTHFFFIFMPFFLVCEKEEFFKAMTRSVGLVFLHFGKTVSLFLVMILVNLRVIVNVIVVVGVPVGLISLATYFATSAYYSLFLGFAGLISLVLIAGAGYLTSILEVFAVSFWYRAFQVFRAADLAEEQLGEPHSDSTELALPGQEQDQSQQTVKVVHVVHHVQQAPGQSTTVDPAQFTDIPGEITEIQEEQQPAPTPKPEEDSDTLPPSS